MDPADGVRFEIEASAHFRVLGPATSRKLSEGFQARFPRAGGPRTEMEPPGGSGVSLSLSVASYTSEADSAIGDRQKQPEAALLGLRVGRRAIASRGMWGYTQSTRRERAKSRGLARSPGEFPHTRHPDRDEISMLKATAKNGRWRLKLRPSGNPQRAQRRISISAQVSTHSPRGRSGTVRGGHVNHHANGFGVVVVVVVEGRFS